MLLHRMTVDDGERTEIYVAERSGEVVMKTSASGRRWGYLGAVMHWLYFTPLRRKSALWSNTIIWVSIAGTIMAFVGFVWGSWRISPFRGYRLGHKRQFTPYAGLMRWHHYAGLAFGLTSITWIFSGLLSMDPWDWSPSTLPTRGQREAVSQGPLHPANVRLPALQKDSPSSAWTRRKRSTSFAFEGTTTFGPALDWSRWIPWPRDRTRLFMPTTCWARRRMPCLACRSRAFIG